MPQKTKFRHSNYAFALWVGALLLTRTGFADHYYVPSGSMEPSIQISDHLLVNKAAFDVKIPFTQKSLLKTNEPARGQIVVFDYPVNPTQVFVKRLVGLPGDHISVRQGQVRVNGERLPETDSPRLSFSAGNDGEWIVPENHYFMMGDNRDNSSDSRAWGFVPRSHLKGRAFALFHWPQSLKFSELKNVFHGL